MFKFSPINEKEENRHPREAKRRTQFSIFYNFKMEKKLIKGLVFALA